MSPFFYVTIFSWTLQKAHVWLHSIPFSNIIDDTLLQSTINHSTVPENTREQSTKFNYKLEQLFDKDDLNGFPHKKVIIEMQINGKVFTINNENSTEWDLINHLINNEIHKRQDHVLFDQERITNDSSTDIIRLIEIISEPSVANVKK